MNDHKLLSDRKSTSQVRIDTYVHMELKIAAARQKTTIRKLVEALYLDSFGSASENNGLGR